MNKTITWVIVALVVVGGIFWYMSMKSTPSDYATNSTSTTTTDTGTPTGTASPKTLKELLAVSSPQTCTYQNNVSGNSVQATVYVANGKLRGDFTTNVGGKITYAHTITNATYSYTWVDGQTVGVKTAVSATSNTLGSNDSIKNLDGFTCTNDVTANPDFTKFNLPKGITFK